MESKRYIQEDTIDLRELFSVFKRKKLLIIGITLLFTLLAVVYSVVTTPVYQVQAVIELGSINDKPIDQLQDVKQKIEHIYEVNVKKKKRPLPRVEEISVNKKSKNILSIKVIGYDNEEATQYIDKVVTDIESEYSEKVETYINTQKELITLTEKNIKSTEVNLADVERTLGDYNQKIMNLTAKDAALAGVYTIQISQNHDRLQKLQDHISKLKEKEYNLKLSITPLNIKRTHIVGKVETLDKPIKPKKTLIIIVAFITGFMFSIFLAFLLEFLKALKKEEPLNN